MCQGFEVVVTHKGWAQTEQFLEALRMEAGKRPQQVPWYPGADARYRAFRKTFPDALELGVPGWDPRSVPLLFAIHRAPREASLRWETWCPALQHVEVEGDDVAAYLEAATKFVNSECWGNLCASVFAPPRVEAYNKAAVAACIEDLKYGTVVVNMHTLLPCVTCTGVWGGHPGNTAEDIQSGNVLTINSLFFDHPQKQVVRMRFGGYFNMYGTAVICGLDFAAAPSFLTLLVVLLRYMVYAVLGF